MLRTRIIPSLLLRNESLVKTVKFGKYTYIGDPCNTVRIFNELEVDELLFLDITATIEGCKPNYELLEDIANECFMPLGYGGGIKTVEDAERIFKIGFEKISVNSFAGENPEFISELAERFGSQSIIASIDAWKPFVGKAHVRTYSGKKNINKNIVEWARELESKGAGEILLTSINQEGTWSGFDVELTRNVANAVDIPVVAQGGGGSLEDIQNVVLNGKASAVALGSMLVFQKKGMGVLVNFPSYLTTSF